MKISSSLSWIGIRPRIFGGFALVLGFLVLLAGFATMQVERIGGTVNELVVSAAGGGGLSQVRASLLSANGAVEKFIRTWNVGDRTLRPRRLRTSASSWIRLSSSMAGCTRSRMV